MAFTYLDSQMIEIPAAIAVLSADNLTVNNLNVNNLQTPTNGNAALWNLAYNIVINRNGSWDSSYNTITALSANWQSTYNSVCGLSANWQSVYSIVSSLSSNWNSLEALSGNWQSTYITVCSLSAAWEESADIVPTVVNYLSTNNVNVKDVTFPVAGGNIFNNTEIYGDVIIYGTLSALSGAQIFEGLTTTVASSLSVQNYGPGPALYVFQDSCLESVVVVKGADNTNVLTVNNTLPDFGQDGVKINYSGTGNTFVVGNSSNNSVFVVTSAGNTNTTGQILSGNIPLHNIFLTSETDSQTLTYIASSYDLNISNGNTVNLSSINTTVNTNSATWTSTYNTVNSLSGTWSNSYTNVQTNSANWESVYVTVCSLSTAWEESNDITSLSTTIQTNSANWQSTYVTVCSLSTAWEESNDILPSVTNYLSTSNIIVSSISATNDAIFTNLVLLSTQTLPALSTDSGIKGTFKWDINYLYICVDTNTWKRVALSGWEG